MKRLIYFPIVSFLSLLLVLSMSLRVWSEQPTRTSLDGGDVIYFILTDRWFDGDTSNNRDVDKSDLRAYNGGDFAGIIEKLPYLKDLGITALWITPVYRQIGEIAPGVNPCDKNQTVPSASYHGYWFSNPYKVDNHLYSSSDLPEGDLRYFKEFVDTMHRNGIKVILDMIFNHTGYHNETYKAEVAANPSETIPNEWLNPPGSDDVVKGQLCDLPDINHDLADVRDFFINNTVAWIETGIDGIRLDTTKHLEDALWRDLKQTIWSKYPQLTWIGEIFNFDVEGENGLASYQNRDGLDSVFDFAFYDAINKTLIENNSLELLAKKGVSPAEEADGLFDKDRLYRDPNLLATVSDNHDLDGRLMTKIKRVYGDTPSARGVMKLILGLQFTTRGIPKIYYGTEVAMEGSRDPHNRQDMRFPTKNPLTGLYNNELVNYTKKLIELRRGSESLKYGTLTTLYSDRFVYAFLRHFGDEETIVIINNRLEAMPEPLAIAIDENANIPSRVKDRLRGKTLTDRLTGKTLTATGSLSIQLPEKGIAILQ